jgi:hypothetical protein
MKGCSQPPSHSATESFVGQTGYAPVPLAFQTNASTKLAFAPLAHLQRVELCSTSLESACLHRLRCIIAPMAGVEPARFRLTVGCSTVELHGNIIAEREEHDSQGITLTSLSRGVQHACLFHFLFEEGEGFEPSNQFYPTYCFSRAAPRPTGLLPFVSQCGLEPLPFTEGFYRPLARTPSFTDS